MNWRILATSMLPVVLGFIPGVPPLLIPVIVQGIQEAEAMPGASGAEKKQHVVTLVHLSIQTLNTAKGHEVITAAQLAAVDTAIDTAVAVVNLVASKH